MENTFVPQGFLFRIQILFRLLWITLFLIHAQGFLSAQNVGVNDDNSNADPNAMLDVKSSTKGVLFPRLTTVQRTTLGSANPANGLLVFDSDTKSYWYWIDNAWVELATSGATTTVPVGSVFPYAGAINDDGSVLEPMPGYLLCNGAVISGQQYPALKNALMNSWGNGNDSDDNTVNLPDLRGMFLRGVNGVRSDGKEDPGDGREAMLVGGNSGNQVGSFQSDAFQGHYHNLVLNGVATEDGIGNITAGTGQPQSLGNSNYASNAISDGANGTPRISSETRPKNAYVHYIIKY